MSAGKMIRRNLKLQYTHNCSINVILISYVGICVIKYKAFECGSVSVFGDSVVAYLFLCNYSEYHVIFKCNFLSCCYVLKIFRFNVYVCVFCNLLVVNCVFSRTIFS